MSFEVEARTMYIIAFILAALAVIWIVMHFILHTKDGVNGWRDYFKGGSDW